MDLRSTADQETSSAGGSNASTLGYPPWSEDSSGALVGDSDNALKFPLGAPTSQDMPAYAGVEPSPPYNGLTIEAWFRTASGFDGTSAIAAFHNGNHHGTDPGVIALGHLGVGLQDGHAFFQAYPGYYVESSGTYNDQQWHQIVGTADGSVIRLWVDGINVGVAGAAPVEFDPGAPASVFDTYLGENSFFVGGDWSANIVKFFAGDVDEVAVYNHAITPTGIVGHYSASGRTPPPGAGIPLLMPADKYGGSNLSSRTVCSCQNNATPYPIDTQDGNFWHTFSDLTIPGRGVPLNLQRTYNSLDAGTDGAFGFGWSSSYTMRLDVAHPDANGNGPVTITQENGSHVGFAWDGTHYSAPSFADGSLTHNGDGSWTFVRLGQTTFRFDTAGRLTSESDRNGYTTALAYDGTGHLSSITDPAGREFTVGWTGEHITSVTDANVSPPRIVQYAYNDANGNLTDVTDVGSGVTHFVYDASHRLTTWLDPNQHGSPSPIALTNDYDSAGRVDWQTDFLGRETTFDYGPSATTVTDPAGHVTVDTYANGVLVAQTRGYGTPQAATTTYAHDVGTLGITTVTDPNNHTTTRHYDEHGNVLDETDALGHQQSWTYNGFDEPLTATDGMGVVTTNTYDGTGNLQSSSTPLAGSSPAVSRTVTYHYDDPAHPGDVTSVTDERGKVTHFHYDAAGNRDSVTDPLGNETKWEGFDGDGRPASIVTPRGTVTGGNENTYRTKYLYDPFGRVTTTTDPLSHQTIRLYDADGNLHSEQDANGHTTTYAYDTDNELTQTQRADNTVTSTDYWPDGTVKSQTDAANHVTTYTYDTLGRRISVTDPLGRVTSYSYDTAGNLKTKQDPGGDCAANPQTGCTTYTYDAANRLTGTAYSDGVTPNITSVSYDNDNRRTAMTDAPGGTQAWSWDSLGRLTSSTVDGDTTGYGYDGASSLVSDVTYPGQTTAVHRAYDDAGNWRSVTDTSGRTTNFDYDPNSNLTTTTFPNSVNVDSVNFDAADQPSSTTFKAGSTTLGSLVYGRDNANQLNAETVTGLAGSSNTYDYNSLEQLTTRNGTPTWSYDAADNLTQTSNGTNQVFDAANQLCATGANPGTCTAPDPSATTYSFDPLGERTAQTAPGGTTLGLGYDQAQRLTTTTAPVPNRSATGAAFTVAIQPDGTVWSAGRNDHGQLGNGTTTDSTSWVPVSVPTGSLSAVAAGWDHAVALKTDGTVLAWGSNASGQLGDNSTSDSSTPVTVSGLSGIVAVTAGNEFSAALRNDGTVWTWGDNTSGQLGDGTYNDQHTPVQVTGLSGVVAISAGSGSLYALKSDGTIWSWGYNGHGELGTGSADENDRAPAQLPGLAHIIAISGGGSHGLGVRTDGTVWSWGGNADGELGNGTTTGARTPVQVSGITDAVAVSAQNTASHAVRADGTLLGWGTGPQIGNGTSTDQLNPVAVPDAGSGITLGQGGTAYHVVVTSNTGVVSSWGDNTAGQLGDDTTEAELAPVRVLSVPVKLAVGVGFSVIIKPDGTVAATGANDSGQLGNNSTTESDSYVTPSGIAAGSVMSVAAGWDHVLALKRDGTVLAWGANYSGQVGNGTTTDAHTPTQVSGLSEIMQVAAGDGFSAALSVDGNVDTWGDNGSGQLGDGTYTERDTPVQVPSLDHVVAIAAGDSTLYALKSDGTAVAWGYNGNGQVGNGTATVNFRTPQTVPGLSRIVAIGAGGLHGIALRSNGDVFTWGDNDSGQLGNNTRTSSTSPIRVSGINAVVSISGENGSTHALRADGSTWSWGAWGQVGDWNAPDDSLIPHQVAVSGVKALAVGPVAYHVAVTKTDTTTEFWGDNSTGAYGDGTTNSSYNPIGTPGTDQAAAAPLTNKPATRYSYDATGLRRSTTDAAAGTTTYTWDQIAAVPLLVGETDAAGNTRYVYGPGGLPVETIEPDGATRYLHHDQLGSTRALTDQSGGLVGSLHYDAYGVVDVNSSPITPHLAYAGQYTDSTTGLQYDRARYYDPLTGTFLTRDPLVDVTGTDYGYADGQPLNNSDPTGQSWWNPFSWHFYSVQLVTISSRTEATAIVAGLESAIEAGSVLPPPFDGIGAGAAAWAASYIDALTGCLSDSRFGRGFVCDVAIHKFLGVPSFATSRVVRAKKKKRGRYTPPKGRSTAYLPPSCEQGTDLAEFV
jgi:RHS repeat-associated protein